MKEYTPIKEGKVREIYDIGEYLIMVATDRISAFDVILKNQITDKGVILTQMSKFWFDLTKDVIANHMITTDTDKMPEFFRNDWFAGRSMMCRKLKMLPVECIVRGYITGSGWASYQKNGTVYIGKLMVHPKMQRKGIGTKLLLEIENEFPNQKYELFTSTKSIDNIRLYEKLGYKKYKEEAVSQKLQFVFFQKH